MYEGFFQLTKRPFSATADSSCFFAAQPVAEALQELVQRARAGQGVGILTAPPGTGKTLLCNRIIADLQDQFTPAFIGNTNFSSRRALLQTILYEYGAQYSGLEEQELRLTLQSTGKTLLQSGRSGLLVIDEAHLLSDRLLEEIRLIANLSEAGTPLFRVILSGQLALEERLTSMSLEALNQRVACHVYLEPFNRQQSIEYVLFRLHWAGGENAERLFTPEALLLVAQVCNGLPRCINQLCDHALLLAFVADSQEVTQEVVSEALSDLKQLPLQWNEPLPAATVTSSQLEAADDLSDEDADDQDSAREDISSSTQEGQLTNTDENSISYEFEVGVGADANVSSFGIAGSGTEPEDDDELPSSQYTLSGTDDISSIDVHQDDAFEKDQTLGNWESIHESWKQPESSHDELFGNDSGHVHQFPTNRFAGGVAPLFDGSRLSTTYFEEELVIDRYAALDAGIPVNYINRATSITSTPDDQQAGTSPAPGQPAVHGESSSDVASPVDQVRLAGPDELIDQIIPLLEQARGDGALDFEALFENDQDSAPAVIQSIAADGAEHQPVENQPAEPQQYELLRSGTDVTGTDVTDAGSQPYFQGAIEDEIEEQIGSNILDMCLAVEECLTGVPLEDTSTTTVQDTSMNANFSFDEIVISTDDLNDLEYDVIQPEPRTAEPKPAPVKATERFTDEPTEPHEVPRPSYKRIFSMLRRKQNR